MFRAYSSRGNNGNRNDTKRLILDIMRLRIEKAQLLGYGTPADQILSDKMAHDAATVDAFLGKKNAIDIDTVSAMYPIKTGAMAPPTIDIIRNDDALLVCSPNPLMANAKIVGNMIDSQRKQRKKLLTPSIPEVKIAEIIAMLAPKPHTIRTFSASILLIIQLPPMRPTVNNPMPTNESQMEASWADIPAFSVA